MDILLKKAKIIVTKDGKKEEIPCCFNPSQYVITSGANYKEDSELGTDGARLVFLSGSLKNLTMTLYFDSVGIFGSVLVALHQEIDPVTDITKKITSATSISGSDHKPPTVAFVWGNLDFEGVLTSVTENFTMFDTSGKPIRAKLDITIKELKNGIYAQKANPFSSPDRTKRKIIIEGMSLWNIAYQEYGDCEKWRIIAKANHIANPLHIYNGQIIKIPAL